MEKIISCQVSFTPIKSEDYLADVKEVLEIIKKSGLQYQIGLLSTVIQGNEEKIFNLLREIYLKMHSVCGFTMDIKISNICGCSNEEINDEYPV